MPLQDFPFDKQHLSIQVRLRLPYYYFTMLPSLTANFMNGAKGMREWKQTGISTQHTLYQLAGFPDPFSMLNFNIELERIPTYYYLKIISGITMVVIMNWLLFGLDMADSNRIAVAATLFLAIIAYLFIVANDVPKVAYATRLDNFILLSLANVFLSCILFTVEYLIDKQAEIAIARAEKESSKKTDDESTATRQEVKENPIKYLEKNSDVSVIEVPVGEGSGTPRTEEDQKPSWYDHWSNHRRKIDALCLMACVLTFCIGAPVLLWA